jgi:DNA recombination protein RmuC
MEIVLAVAITILLIVLLFLAWSLRGVSQRISTIEQGQGTVGQNLSLLQSELSGARQGLTALQSQAEVRALTDRQVADSVRRLETIIAGTQSKGEAGENILEVVFSKLPPEWQVRDFTVGNKTVEFALRLPNNRILPIDSKWPATDLIERLARCDDPVERRRLKTQIGATVIAKAKEVKKYLDPALTLNFGIAAVPDAVYDLCGDVQVACYEQDVVLVAYSMFIPYLLLVFQTVLKTSQDIDLEKLNAHLRTAEQSVRALQQELEGRFSRAITMMANSKSEMSAHLSRIDSSLTNVHIRAGTPVELPDDLQALPVAEED